MYGGIAELEKLVQNSGKIITLLFWHLPASVFFWGDSLVFFELTNEIADVVKATVNGNIRNIQ